MLKLGKIAMGFFKGIILNDWSSIHDKLPLPEDDPLWRAKVYKKRGKNQPGKLSPCFCSDSDKEARDRIGACKAHIAEDFMRSMQSEENQKSFWVS